MDHFSRRQYRRWLGVLRLGRYILSRGQELQVKEHERRLVALDIQIAYACLNRDGGLLKDALTDEDHRTVAIARGITGAPAAGGMVM